MKRLLLFIIVLSLYSTGTWAQSFTTGYSSFVVYSDGHTSRPAGEDEVDCIENESRIIADYLRTHPEVVVVESRSLPCGPRTGTVPDLDLAAWSKLPIPPLCTSCPLLQPETFEIYYPEFVTEIKDLYHQYKIDKYNFELTKLQQKYDLQHFEAAVFKLNNEINRSKQ